MTPATEVLHRNLVSCGTITTLAAYMLRCNGLAVKLIHGKYEKDDHAWLHLWDDSKGRWIAFDFMDSRDPEDGLSPEHQPLAECADWRELVNILDEASRKYSAVSQPLISRLDHSKKGSVYLARYDRRNIHRTPFI